MASTPADDRALSPYTGWTREHWVNLAERILTNARRYGTDDHARIHIPGTPGGYGAHVDGLEGFARTFLAAGFLAAGDPTRREPLSWYAEGFRTGPDPTRDPSRRWVRPSEHDQAKVEACSLALILHMTRPYLWDTFDSRTQELTVDYLAEWISASYPKNNWVWFRLITERFLRSIGGPWSREDQEEDLEFHESCYVRDGWYRDGTGRTFDYYGGWVFHVYPLLWCDMIPDDPESIRLRPIFAERLNRYLDDAIHLIGADGAILGQGRSLIYRFAAAAPLWMSALTGTGSLRPGLVRRACSGVVKHFVTHGAPDENGLLSMGWHGPWRTLAQSYSGPGSPYWACKGLLGLALPADHEVWTAPEEPLPVDAPVGADAAVSSAIGGARVSSPIGGPGASSPVTDTQAYSGPRALPVPGWIISGTRDDGIVRVINHGTDHDTPGSTRADSPLYAQLGYSTATFPVLGAAGWVTPSSQSVCLVDAQGRASHRSGFTPLCAWVDVHAPNARARARVGIAASRAQAHWVDPADSQFLHGSGYIGSTIPAGEITVLSLVRGPWEVRAIRVNPAPAAVTLRVTGWALSGAEILSNTSSDTADGFALIQAERGRDGHRLTSSVRAISTTAMGGVYFHDDASPLGGVTAVPRLDFPILPGTWVTMLITLSGHGSSNDSSEGDIHIGAHVRSTSTPVGTHLAIPADGDTEKLEAHILWPDQVTTHSTIECAVGGRAVDSSRPSGRVSATTVPQGTTLKGETQ